jgi:hypothetical protein
MAIEDCASDGRTGDPKARPHYNAAPPHSGHKIGLLLPQQLPIYAETARDCIILGMPWSLQIKSTVNVCGDLKNDPDIENIRMVSAAFLHAQRDPKQCPRYIHCPTAMPKQCPETVSRNTNIYFLAVAAYL